MSIEDNQNLVHHFYGALESGDYATVIGMFHDDFVFYSQIDTPRPGPDGFLTAEKENVDAFNDIRMTVERIVSEGDQVGAYVVVEGDQTGEFASLPPGRNPHAFLDV